MVNTTILYPALSYDRIKNEPERNPCSSWFNSKEIGMNHIDPVHENGRKFPYLMIVDRTPENSVKSTLILERFCELNYQFKPWSSGGCNVIGDRPNALMPSAAYLHFKAVVVFYFSEQSDAAMFKLIWEGL